MKQVIIQLNNVSYSIGSENISLNSSKSVDILSNISLKIYKKEILGICGESGGGKTTLIKLIAGVLSPVKGEMKVDHKISIRKNRTNKIQILFQNSSDLLNPLRKVKDVIDEIIELSENKNVDMEKEKVRLFSMLGIASALENRRGNELSGGERQRIALARLLATKPRILILDEPFSAQDVISQLNFLKILKRINSEMKITIICVSHDLNLLKKLVDRVVVLQNGRIVETAITSKLFKSPKHSYTKFLLRAEEFSLTEDEIHSYNPNKTSDEKIYSK